MSVHNAPDEPWQAQGNCTLWTSHLFGAVDAADRHGQFQQRLAKAKAICDSCPVAEQCISLAQTERLTGVFGGAYLSVGRVVDASQVRVAS